MSKKISLILRSHTNSIWAAIKDSYDLDHNAAQAYKEANNYRLITLAAVKRLQVQLDNKSFQFRTEKVIKKNLAEKTRILKAVEKVIPRLRALTDLRDSPKVIAACDPTYDGPKAKMDAEINVTYQTIASFCSRPMEVAATKVPDDCYIAVFTPSKGLLRYRENMRDYSLGLFDKIPRLPKKKDFYAKLVYQALYDLARCRIYNKMPHIKEVRMTRECKLYIEYSIGAERCSHPANYIASIGLEAHLDYDVLDYDPHGVLPKGMVIYLQGEEKCRIIPPNNWRKYTLENDDIEEKLTNNINPLTNNSQNENLC